MNAIKFPNMLNLNKAEIVTDTAATYQNLKYLLLAAKKSLLGDPYFGSRLQELLYEKNNIVLQDLVIDEIFSCINTYMPQLAVNRSDIKIRSHRERVDVSIKAQNIIDYNFENYTLELLTAKEI